MLQIALIIAIDPIIGHTKYKQVSYLLTDSFIIFKTTFFKNENTHNIYEYLCSK